MTLIHEGFLSRVFKINELKTEVANHLAMLEKKVECECPFIPIPVGTGALHPLTCPASTLSNPF